MGTSKSPQTKTERRLLPAEAQPWYRRLRWGDFFVTGLIVMLAIVLLLSAPQGLTSQARVAVLTSDGRTIFTRPIAELQSEGSFTHESQGYHYLIAYGNGQIRFATADCPDQVCVRTGWVERNGQVAACVPGHLILKITGPSQPNDDIDIVMQ